MRKNGPYLKNQIKLKNIFLENSYVIHHDTHMCMWMVENDDTMTVWSWGYRGNMGNPNDISASVRPWQEKTEETKHPLHHHRPKTRKWGGLVAFMTPMQEDGTSFPHFSHHLDARVLFY